MGKRNDTDDCRLMHGMEWQGQDLTGWLITEKMDGCRAYWTGSELITRRGARIDAPSHITTGLPHGVAIDGELWAGRGNFELARRAVQLGSWHPDVRFVAFDTPDDSMPPNERLELARNLITNGRNGASEARAAACGWPGALVPLRMRSTNEAMGVLRTALANGAEGLMALAPSSLYRPGRTDRLLKLKAPALEMAREFVL